MAFEEIHRDAEIDWGSPKDWEPSTHKLQVRIALRNCGHIDPENINHYIAKGGYSGLNRALKMTPEQVIEEVSRSGLKGRGGAGFPTGTKWQFCRESPGREKYLICNAHEGDPKAIIGRTLLENDPHSVLEGMLIGAYAISAKQGYIYVNAENALAITRLKKALRQSGSYGFLGDNILGSNFSFHMEIKEGVGDFICGEETAMLCSLEGKRSMPYPRPPFPTTSGLKGQPTNINNVETWAHVSAILQKDAEWYSGYGTQESRGTKIFYLIGNIMHPGVIEVPMGTTLQRIIYDIGGGFPSGKAFKAVQVGGTMGGFVPDSMLNLAVDYEQLTNAGAMMGSGCIDVYNSSVCMVDLAKQAISFAMTESCGKCVICREGTVQMLEILTDITEGKGETKDIDLLIDIAEGMKWGSLCALGKMTPNPVLTGIRYFRKEYEEHIRRGRCPSVVCQKLIS